MLRIPALDAGFFANLNNVVSVLGTCLGKDGVRAARVDWTVRPGMSDFSYGEVGTNVWDQFFEPLDFAQIPAEETDAPVFPDYSITDIYAYRLHKRDRRWRREKHAIYERFVKLRPHVQAHVDAIATAMFSGGPIIGVHARHSGISVENVFDVPTAGTFVAHAHRLAEAYPGARILLATDSQAAAQVFAQAFGNRLLMQNGVERSGGDGQVHQGPGGSQARGLAVLTDALLLAKCNALLHVNSNIATAVGYINPNLQMHLCESRPQALIGTVVATMMRVKAVSHGVRSIRRARDRSR